MPRFANLVTAVSAAYETTTTSTTITRPPAVQLLRLFAD
jgi:hypothetical protein